MREFFHQDDSHVHNEFNNFKKTHNKKYDSELEHKERLHIFRNNLRLVAFINKKKYIKIFAFFISFKIY